MTSPDMSRLRRFVMLAVTVASLAFIAACGGETQRAETTSRAVDSVPAAEPGPTGTAEENVEATEGGQGSDLEPAQVSTPLDADLDIETRHPAGVVIRLNRIAFEGNDILLGAELINGARWSVKLHDDGHPWNLLRLVDEAGQEYHYVETDEGDLVLEPGESVTGTLAFRGPLVGRSERVRLVINTRPSAVDNFDMDRQMVGSGLPTRFVIPIDVTWE